MLNGKKHISPAVAEMLASEIGIPNGKLPHETLSNREYQIFMLLASAKTVAEIADTLKLSSKTISIYRSRVMEKMHLHNNAQRCATPSITSSCNNPENGSLHGCHE